MNKKAFTIMEIVVVVSVLLVMAAVLAPFMRMVKQRAKRIRCENNLMRISLGLHQYAAANKGVFPPSLEALYPKYVGDTKAFNCPAGKRQGTPESSDYNYVAGLSESSSPSEVIVYDADENHGKAGKNVLKVDGEVDWSAR